MPRPLRIEYENAYYHVINRGRGRQRIFHDDDYFRAFLSALEEAHQRFGLQVLCYCLMPNHYHLLVKTPNANLGRCMRHINGVYTQRYNRRRKTDGPLFRGRYKAILVEEDSYQLQLSRYIHRNPLEAELVHQLEEYPWSSYPYYVTSLPAPAWLYRDEIYGQMHAKSHRSERYQSFVEQGVDEELATLYSKGNQQPYLGSEEFRDWAYRQRHTDENAVSAKELQPFQPSMEAMATSIGKRFGLKPEAITTRVRGRSEENVARWVMMYLARDVGGHKLRAIANFLGLKRTGSIPTQIAKLRTRMESDEALKRKVDALKSEYDT